MLPRPWPPNEKRAKSMGPFAGSPLIETIHQVIEWVALGIEVLAVAVIVAAVMALAIKRGTVRYLFHI